MYCEKCGAKLENSSIFCEECGTKVGNENSEQGLIQNQPQQNVRKKSFSIEKLCKTLKNLWQSHKIAIVFSEIVIILLAVFIIVGAIISNPARIAKKYFKAYINNDYSTMYDLGDFNKDFCLTSKENYLEIKNKESKISDEILGFTIEEEKIESSYSDADDELIENYFGDYATDYYAAKKEEEQRIAEQNRLQKTFVVTYRVQGEINEHTMTLTLNRQSDKSLLFFDKYKVINSDVKKDLPISIPKGTTLMIDGNEIPSEYIYSESDATLSYDRYVIPYIFSGKHDIEITSDLYETIIDEFDTEKTVSYVDDCELKESISNELINNFNKYMNDFATTAFNQGDFSQAKELIKYTVSSTEDLKEAFNYIKAKYTFDGKNGNLNHKVTSVETKVSEKSGIIYVISTVNYNYTQQYYSFGNKYEYPYSNKIRVSCKLNYNNGNLNITEIEIY